MLRITTKGNDATGVTLGLEGRIVDAWVGVMEQECSYWLARECSLWLDMSGVTYVDSRGVERLRLLQNGGVHIVSCPELLRRMLEVEED